MFCGRSFFASSTILLNCTFSVMFFNCSPCQHSSHIFFFPTRKNFLGIMKFIIKTILPILLALSSTAAHNINVDHKDRQNVGTTNLRRNLKKQSQPCTVLIASDTRFLDDGFTHSEDEIVCELDSKDAENGLSGQIVPMLLTQAQKAKMLKRFNEGSFVSGRTLYHDTDAILTPKGIQVPSNKAIALKNSRHFNRRKLASHSGVKSVLAVKVTDENSAIKFEVDVTEMSENIFGGGNDPINMASQFTACSHGKFNLTPANDTDLSDHLVAPGVIHVDVDINFQALDRYEVRNAVTTAVEEQLNFTLPGPFAHVMYLLPDCYNSEGCGWAGWAYVNHWNSIYKQNYYAMPGVQLHEIGHNLGFAHSGGLDGMAYSDHTCMMGNPLYGDDNGKMCFNPAKNWQLDWYDSNKHIVTPTDSSFTGWSGTLVGVAEYDIAGSNPVVVKIETGTSTDYFVGFNRATRANAQNDEADDEVTIIQTGNNGEGYSQSRLLAHLVQGESYTFVDFQGSGEDLVVTAKTIDTSSTPGRAEISIMLGDETPPPTSSISPTNSPSMSTSEPTTSPTASPAPSNSPSMSTLEPTTSPTASLAPTNSPSKSPSAAPTTPAPSPCPVCGNGKNAVNCCGGMCGTGKFQKVCYKN